MHLRVRVAMYYLTLPRDDNLTLSQLEALETQMNVEGMQRARMQSERDALMRGMKVLVSSHNISCFCCLQLYQAFGNTDCTMCCT